MDELEVIQDVTIIIPTMLKVEKRMFQYLLNEMTENEYVKKVIIIDNTGDKLFRENFSITKKMTIVENDENVGVNPAWNQGMKLVETPFYCIINDDILCEREIVTVLRNLFLEDKSRGIATVFAADPRIHKINQEAYRLQKRPETPTKYEILPDNRYDGWFFFGRSEDWVDIDERMKIFYGDNFIYCHVRSKGLKSIILTSRFIVHEVSTTVIATDMYNKNLLETEGAIWKEISAEKGYAKPIDLRLPEYKLEEKKEDAQGINIETEDRKISLCMIVKDEEKNLKRCLESVKDVVDEIIIIDTGSSDNTKSIARKYTPKVFSFDWNGSFADARNESLSYATGDWILIMDADEVLASGSRQTLLELANVPLSRPVAYQVKVRNAIAEGEGVEHFVARLFPNNFEIKFRGSIHEFLETDKNLLNVTTERIVLDHYGYNKETIDDKDKINRNVDSLKKELEKDPDSPFYLYHLGLTYRVAGKHKEAIETFEKWDKRVFEMKELDVSMGYSAFIGELVSGGEDERAMGIYLSVKDRCIHNPDFCLNAAIALEHLKKYDESEELLNRCIATKSIKIKTLSYDKDSNGWKALAVLGNLKARKGEHKEAIEIWEKALLSTRKNKEIYKAIVSSALRSQNLEKAETYLIALMELNPTENIEQNTVSLANVYISGNQPEKAIDVINRLPNSKSLIDQLLTALISANNFATVKRVDAYLEKLKKEEEDVA